MKQIKLQQFLFICISALLIFNLPALAESKKFELGKSISPYDRGSSEQTAKEQNKKDLELMKKYYKGDSSEGDCFRREEIGKCHLLKKAAIDLRYKSYTCRDLGLRETVPYYEYYVPFQKLEHVEVPFTTAYLDKDTVGGFLKQSAESLYDNGVDGAKQSTKRVVDTLKEMGFDGDQTKLVSKLSEERKRILDEVIDEFSLKDSRFRSDFRGDGRYMETHVLPTEFDTVYKEEYEDSWVHQGAINSWIEEKPPVPIWFSEFPGSILAMRYSELARKVKGIGEHMSDRTAISNCVGKKLASSNFKSELPDEIKGDSNCLKPEIYGVKFSAPFNFDAGTIYATQAATKRDLTGLLLALKLADHYKSAFKDGAFHELQEKTGIDEQGRTKHKKDLIQFLDRRQTAKTKQGKKAEGCFMADEANYLPDIDWSKQKEANRNEDGERFVTAHYRYVRGCPVCYGPAKGTPEPILK